MSELDYYQKQLLTLAACCSVALLFDRFVVSKQKAKANKPSLTTAEDVDRIERGKYSSAHGVQAAKLATQYLLVYGIVMAADWLQGPYVYSLYKEQYGFPERLVAILFVTGFVSAGVMAPLVGVWADQYGRKRLCLVFCITYTLACTLILIPWLPILLLGRVLGGISTSILFSAFETWVVSASNSQGLPQSELSTILGRATLLNALVATAAGIASNKLVGTFHTFTSPFIASGALLCLGWVVINSMWIENYGSVSPDAQRDLFQLKRMATALQIVQNDPGLLVLGLTQTCFEGSMYLFVFLWVPSLQEVARSDAALPLGYIFSSFMISMMLGSLLYTAILAFAPSFSRDTALTTHAKLSSLVCAASGLALALATKYNNAELRFWFFCLFEACVGMYYPVQGTLRSALVTDEHRATLSSLFRVPLNIFVVVSLVTGVSSARYAVLTASALMLAFSSVMTGFVIVKRVSQQEATSRKA